VHDALLVGPALENDAAHAVPSARTRLDYDRLAILASVGPSIFQLSGSTWLPAPLR